MRLKSDQQLSFSYNGISPLKNNRLITHRDLLWIFFSQFCVLSLKWKIIVSYITLEYFILILNKGLNIYYALYFSANVVNAKKKAGSFFN